MRNPHSHGPAAGLATRVSDLAPQKRALFKQQPRAERLDGHQLVATALRNCGITHIYSVPGAPTREVLPACHDRGIRPLGVYHQTSAVCMAVAQNYQKGSLVAAAMVSAGPAATNAITGLLVAHDNGWPVIVLGGRRSSFQKLDVLPLLAKVTKYVVNVPRTGVIRECIHEACRIAVSHRPGPVYVDLHEDVLTGYANAGPRSDGCDGPPGLHPPNASTVEIEKIASAIVAARRPAMLLGKGVRWTVVPAQLRALIDTLGMPFITSPMGRGFIPEDHPLCFNWSRTALQSEADVVLILGARLNWMFRHGAELSRDARIFRIDIHHDHDDDAVVETEFVHADAGDFVQRLLDALQARHDAMYDAYRQQRIRDWQQSLRTVADAARRGMDEAMNSDQRPMSPYRMMREVRNALPRDGICITEGNISMLAAQPVIPGYQPAARMDAGTNGCMGVGIPFAIGAKVACPDRTVVAVTGDFAFSLSAMEMEVCVRHGIPIVVVVANNQGNNGAIYQQTYFPGKESERVFMFQPGLDYDRIMKVFGGRGATISDPGLLRSALENAISSGVPYCINVEIDPEMPIPNAWGNQYSVRPHTG